MLRHHPPTPSQGKLPRIKYVTQAATRPPTFVAFTNRVGLSREYERFLTNALREEFNLHGVPVRLVVNNQSAQQRE